MQPKSVGIREAKIQLSKQLNLVKGGNEVILTDRGQPVGKIVPIESQSLPLEARIRRLENQGTRWCDEQFGQERPWRKVTEDGMPEIGPLSGT